MVPVSNPRHSIDMEKLISLQSFIAACLKEKWFFLNFFLKMWTWNSSQSLCRALKQRMSILYQQDIGSSGMAIRSACRSHSHIVSCHMKFSLTFPAKENEDVFFLLSASFYLIRPKLLISFLLNWNELKFILCDYASHYAPYKHFMYAVNVYWYWEGGVEEQIEDNEGWWGWFLSSFSITWGWHTSKQYVGWNIINILCWGEHGEGNMRDEMIWLPSGWQWLEKVLEIIFLCFVNSHWILLHFSSFEWEIVNNMKIFSYFRPSGGYTRYSRRKRTMHYYTKWMAKWFWKFVGKLS